MCGIAGFNLHPDDVGVIDTTTVSEALLHDIVTRGRDATGAAWFDPETGRCMVQKNDDPATKFVGYMDVPKNTQTAIFHTRASTQGSPTLNENNHPIVVRDLVGIHNGVCRNDDEIFEMVGEEKRTAQVDSEAIFAAINFGHWQTNGKPAISDNLLKILGVVKGGAAIAWLEYATQNSLKLARISSSPLMVATSENGSFFFASTALALRDAARKADFKLQGSITDDTHAVPEGTYLQVVEGSIVASHSFEPATKNEGESWRQASAGYGTKGKDSPKKGSTATSGKSSTAPKSSPGKPGKKDKPSDTSSSKGSGTGTTKASEKAATAKASDESDSPGDNFMVSPNGEIVPIADLMAEDKGDKDTAALIQTIHYSLVGSIGSIGTPVTRNNYEFDTRFDAINDYTEGLSTTDDKQFFQITADLGAWHEIGDWGYLSFAGQEETPCQLVSMPDTFPGGKYVLRAYIQNEKVVGGYETVLVNREIDEFDLTADQESPLVTPKK